jgi:hypothetical protein
VSTPSKSDVIVTLADGTRTVAEAASQIQAIAATAKKPGARVFVHPEPARAGGVLGRLFGKKTVPRSVRASALLACGYVELGAGEDDGVDWVWGSVPSLS